MNITSYTSSLQFTEETVVRDLVKGFLKVQICDVYCLTFIVCIEDVVEDIEVTQTGTLVSNTMLPIQN